MSGGLTVYTGRGVSGGVTVYTGRGVSGGLTVYTGRGVSEWWFNSIHREGSE